MTCFELNQIHSLEEILANHLLGVATDLRLVEVADYIAFIRTAQLANLRTLVQSSTELHFKPGTLYLSDLGEIIMAWGKSALIVLPMQFRFRGIEACFKLKLAPYEASVELISLNGLECDSDNLISKFERVLFEARIQRLDSNPLKGY